MTIAEAQGLWTPAGPYLDTASYGLPPRPAWEALQAALDGWRRGQARWEAWCQATERARSLFGRLVGVSAEQVAAGASVSYLVSLVAASLPDGARVVVPEGDFSSLTWPFLVQRHRGVEVLAAPLSGLADAVDRHTDAVAFSLVQSSTGEVADWEAVAEAAGSVGALTVADGTHACGWLPLDASRFDALVCAAYKWLLSPRGTALAAFSRRLLDRMRPLAANWYAADDPFGRYYEPELRLTPHARRLDLSPAWFSWVGAAPALEVLLAIGIERIHAHNLALADRFRAGLGLPAGRSAIVAACVPGAERRLGEAGIRAASRAGWLRASFHVYNTEGDVDAALAALLGRAAR